MPRGPSNGGPPPADGAGDAAVSDSGCLASRVLSGLALIAASVVAGQAGHKPLGIVAIDVFKELSRATPAKGNCRTIVVADDDIITTKQERETLQTRHAANPEDPTANGALTQPKNVLKPQ